MNLSVPFSRRRICNFFGMQDTNHCVTNDNGKLMICRTCCKAFSPIDLVDATLRLKMEQYGLDCIPTNSSVRILCFCIYFLFHTLLFTSLIWFCIQASTIQFFEYSVEWTTRRRSVFVFLSFSQWKQEHSHRYISWKFLGWRGCTHDIATTQIRTSFNISYTIVL